MAIWLVPRSELTVEQLRAVELPYTRHQAIMGGPGSGKTIVLLHRARYLADQLGTEDAFRIFVYTNTLKDYIKSAVDMLDLPQKHVMTLDSWCTDYYRKNISIVVPRNGQQPDFDTIRREVWHNLKVAKPEPIYKFVLVDEGQDLTFAHFQILTLISRHITVVMDNKQQLYETGSNPKDVLNLLNARNASVSFLECYRCSKHIVELAAQFIPDPTERNDFISQTSTIDRGIETPVIFIAADAKRDELDNLIDTVRSRVLNNENVAVLFPTRRMVFGYVNAFEEAGLEVETMDRMDFSSGKPKLLTYHSAKGLTFDTVILPRVVNYSFARTADDVIARRLFVGITRATQWVYISTVDGQEISLLQTVIDDADPNMLSVINYLDDAWATLGSGIVAEDDDDIMDLF